MHKDHDVEIWGTMCELSIGEEAQFHRDARADEGKQYGVHCPDVNRGYLLVIIDVTMPVMDIASRRLTAVTFHVAPLVEGNRRQRADLGGGSVGERTASPMRATLIAISIALIIGGLYLIGFELMWATSIDTKFVLFVIVGVASTTLGGVLLLVEKFL